MSIMITNVGVKTMAFTAEQEAYIAAEVKRRLEERPDKVHDRILTKIDRNTGVIKIILVLFVITIVAEYCGWHI